MIARRNASTINLPTVSSEIPELKEALESAFRSVRNDSRYSDAGRRPYQRYLQLAEDLDSIAASYPIGVIERAEVVVEYAGDNVSFGYSGPIPPRLVADYSGGILPNGDFYDETNEHYDHETVRLLRSATGVTHYLGTLGGVDGVLAQLSVLQQSSTLSGISIVDGNATQIFYGMTKLYAYDLSGTPTVGFSSLANTMMHPQKGTRLDISLDDIANAVMDTSEPGVKFIYLSNIFDMLVILERPSARKTINIDGWNREPTTKMVLKSILDNQSILDGSYVMLARPGGTTALLLKKASGSFSVHSFVIDVYDGNGSYTLDVRSQQALLDTVSETPVQQLFV